MEPTERGSRAVNRAYLMPCLVAVAVAVAVLLVAGVEVGTLSIAAVAIACPLMMLLMMGGMFRGMKHHHGSRGRETPSEGDPAVHS